MKKGEKSKKAIIDAAITLLNEKGYYGTSTNEILSRAGAPRGSMYYHFPGGKDEITIAAITAAGLQISAALQTLTLHAEDPYAAIDAIYAFFQQELLASDFACGCPISTVALECSGKESLIANACKEVYMIWEQHLLDFLKATKEGDEAQLKELSSLLFSLIEGALLLARSTADLSPLEIAKKHSKFLLDLQLHP